MVASSIVDKYIGESARVIREMFAYAKENQPCIIFMDEIDAIGGKRLSDGSSADREIQRTLMEVKIRRIIYIYQNLTKMTLINQSKFYLLI